jgi:hypothetical protein
MGIWQRIFGLRCAKCGKRLKIKLVESVDTRFLDGFHCDSCDKFFCGDCVSKAIGSGGLNCPKCYFGRVRAVVVEDPGESETGRRQS